MELLLTVDNHFLVKDRGLVITPDLDRPRSFLFIPFREQVVIQSPDRDAITLTAEFNVVLFVIGREDDPRIVIMFPEGSKELIPIGSQVFVTQELSQYLKGEYHNP